MVSVGGGSSKRKLSCVPLTARPPSSDVPGSAEGAGQPARASAPARGCACGATGPAENWGRPEGGTDCPLARPGGRISVPSPAAPGGTGSSGVGSSGGGSKSVGGGRLNRSAKVCG